MRKLYETDYGDVFDNFDDAIESVRENISWDEVVVELENRIPYRTLLDYAWDHSDFSDAFCDEIIDAEDTVALQYITELDDPETEEEE